MQSVKEKKINWLIIENVELFNLSDWVHDGFTLQIMKDIIYLGTSTVYTDYKQISRAI